MMHKQPKRSLVIALAAAGAVASGVAQAAPIQMTGNFLWTQVSDDGTLGNGSASPGLIHDATGTGTFDAATGDYLRPGSPHEGFGVKANEFGLAENNNNHSGGAVASNDDVAQTSLTDLSAGTTNHVRWVGRHKSGYFDITHDYLFGDGDENVTIQTTLTALLDMTNVRFSRAIDPDPDNYSGGTASTNNERGLDLNDDGDYDDAGELAREDFVSAEGSLSGLTMAMYTNSGLAHNTGIESSCCSVLDPDDYLAGGDFAPSAGFDSIGDDGIGLGFSIGNMLVGESVTITYAYVFGDTVGTVDIPDDVPEPTTLALLGLGIAGFAARRRRS